MRWTVIELVSALCAILGIGLCLELVAVQRAAADPLPGMDPCPPPGGRAPSINTIRCLSGPFIICAGKTQSECNNLAVTLEEWLNDVEADSGAILFSDDSQVPDGCTQEKVNRKCKVETINCYRYVYCLWKPNDIPPHCENDPDLQGMWHSADKRVEDKCDPTQP